MDLPLGNTQACASRPDRIAAATYLCCTACAGGDVDLLDAEPDHMAPVLETLEAMGCAVTARPGHVHIGVSGRLRAPGAVVTRPYPGFPTDAAPLLMAACLKVTGPAVFIENIFSGRYRHAEELRRLGADITIRGPLAMVTGVESLHGANLTSPDLRGGAALVAAALGAEGPSLVYDDGTSAGATTAWRSSCGGWAPRSGVRAENVTEDCKGDIDMAEEYSGSQGRVRTGSAWRAPLALVLLFAVAVIFMSLFFRVARIEVVNASEYTDEQVVEASGIEMGANLFFIDRFPWPA